MPLAALPDKVRYNEHVRPILSANCFACHGADEKHREADLRLDLRDEAVKQRDGYAVLVPGKPDQSLLLERITSSDPDEAMPPPQSKKPRLSEQEVAILRGGSNKGRSTNATGLFCRWPINRRPRSEAKPGPATRSTSSSSKSSRIKASRRPPKRTAPP